MLGPSMEVGAGGVLNELGDGDNEADEGCDAGC